MPRTDRSGPSPRGGTGTCFRRRRRSSLGGRPSTTSTSMRRPPSAPPPSTAVIVGPVSRSEARTFPTRIRCRAGALKRAASGAGICIRSGGDDADDPVSAVSLNMRRHGAPTPRGDNRAVPSRPCITCGVFTATGSIAGVIGRSGPEARQRMAGIPVPHRHAREDRRPCAVPGCRTWITGVQAHHLRALRHDDDGGVPLRFAHHRAPPRRF
jgi:hypothetical protein